MSRQQSAAAAPTPSTPNRGDRTLRAESDAAKIALGVLAGLLWGLWQGVRAIILALLVILEPVVALVLTALALLLSLTAVFWKLASNRPDFPFFLVLGAAVACFLALTLYRGLIHALSGRRWG